jgi:uncharacterized protein
VGESGKNFAFGKVVFGDFVEDAVAVAARVRSDTRFSAVSVLGHSEGGRIAIDVAARGSVDGLILVATAGRPLAVLLREQLSRQLDAAQLAEVDRIVAAIRADQPADPIPDTLKSLFAPSVRPFLRSIIDSDPAPALAALRVPVVIVQGETDAQVSVEDARLLAAARPDARCVILPRVNHVLKEEAARALPQASYADGSRPLAPGVVDAVLSGVARTRAG